MSGLQHRQPGLVGATLNHSTVMASIIPDGYHVDFAAISIAKKIMQERLFVITDAVTTTKDGHYKHELFENKYESNGTLSGSALTMEKAVLNLMQYCNINFEEACRMCSLYPAKAINLDHEIGKIEIGYKAAFFDWPTEV
jgi:N-acetylglucosamine-6-phosphate deacetylase